MKYVFSLILLLISLFQYAQDLVIVHSNDLHSHLNGFSPEAEYTPLIHDNDPTRGGFSRIAGFINSEKKQYEDKLLVVDAGDFLMGTFFQTLELSEGFQLNLMKKIGYDFVALGNHEFDFGPGALAEIINHSLQNGEIPQLLNTNYKEAKSSDGSKLMRLFENKVILPYSVIEKNGYILGIFSLIGKDANESISDDYGIILNNQKKVAKQTAKYLKNVEKVDLVIVLSHSGVEKDKKGEWAGEDVEYAEAAPDIDIIISGHTHTCLPEPIYAGNAVIVQTGALGMYMGKLEIYLQGREKPQVKYTLTEMNDDIEADEQVQQMIDAKVPVLEKTILSNIGVGYNEIIGETSFDLVLDENDQDASNLGPFIADAIYNTLNKSENTATDVVFVASGVIRNNIVKGNTGKQNINDIYNIMPLGRGEDAVPGHPLAKVYVYGNELKEVLELILHVYPDKHDYYLYFSGLEIDYNPEKGLFKKISAIRVGNPVDGYREIDISKKSNDLICIAANKYMISFIGRLKKMSFGLVNVVPKKADGSVIADQDFLIDMDPDKEGIQEAKEWVSMYRYIKGFEDINGNGIPDIPVIYKTKTNPLFVKE